MAAKTQNPITQAIDPSELEAKVKQIRDVNEKVLIATKQAGLASLDAYESALSSLLELEGKLAGKTRIEWVSAITDTHAGFVSGISKAYVSAARDVLA